MLYAVHLNVSVFLKVPEIALEETEAKQVANAIADVAQHYDFAPDEKTMAWVNLGMVLAGTYGTRVGAYMLRVKEERKEHAKNPNVVAGRF